jgi:hypothetical protein
VTGGWAATNTLREALDGLAVWNGPDAENLAALALVEAALDAAEEFVYPTDYRPGAAYRREQALAAALRAVRAGDKSPPSVDLRSSREGK